MKKIIILILLILPFLGHSQNWELFNLNQKTYYAQTLSNTKLKVESFIADSTKSGQNQTIYFNRKIGLSNNCFNNIIQESDLMIDWRNPNIIDSLIIKGDSVLYISDFYTSYIDTFLFLPKSNVGDTWQTTQNDISITCIEETKEIILGIEDSIKIFSISTEPYNNIQFKLSKKYGLVEFLPFREFVYHYQNSEFEPIFRLIGYEKNNEKNGYSQPKFEDYFHLHQRDMLFWKHYSNPDDINQPEMISYQVDSITSSYLSSDSVNYNYQMKRYDEFGNLTFTGNYSYIYTDKWQGKILNTPTSWFNVMPPSYYDNDVYFTEPMYLEIENNDTISNFGYSIWGLMLDTLDCTISTASDYDQTYRFSTREGLIYTASFSWGENSRTLIGSIINGNIHGDTNLPTNIQLKQENNLIIYPNPTNGKINFKTNESIENIVIIDIFGRIILETTKNKIDLTNYNKGMYILKVKTKNSIFIETIINE